MSTRLLRFLMTGLLCLSVGFVAACGDDGDGGDGPECTLDTDCEGSLVCDNGTCVEPEGCTDDAQCAEGEICEPDVCVAGCRDNNDCSGGQVCQDDNTCGTCSTDDQCDSGEFCNDSGACEEQVEAQCETVNEECTPGEPTASGFICGDPSGLGPICLATCTPPAEGQPDPCTSGSFCNPGQPGQPGVCIPSQCQGPLDTDGCAEEVAADETGEYANGATCLPVGNGANLCIPAGTGAEGDACDTENRCGEGLICGFDNTCKPPCASDSDCTGDDRCVGENSDAVFTTGVGLCGSGCDSFSTGQCPENTGCFPISEEDGICIEVGDKPAYATCTATQQCTDNADCPSGNCVEGVCDEPVECGEGTRCLGLEGDPNPQARCLPICDATPLGGDNPDQAAADATCPGTGEPQAYTRFLHLAQGAGDVDIYVNGTLVVDDRSNADFTQVISRDFQGFEPGRLVIEVTDAAAADNSTPLASLETNLPMNAQATIAVVESSTGVEIVETNVPRDVAAPAAGEAKARLVHAAAEVGAVDIYLVASGDPVGPSDTPFATNVAFGEATAFSDSVAAGDYDVVLFATGATPGTDTPAATLSVTLPADAIGTGYATGVTSLAPALVAYAQADISDAGGLCFDLNAQSGDAPTVNSGICFQRCSGPEAYGEGQCDNQTDACTPFRGVHACWPTQNIEVGASCPTTSLNPCEAGAYCRTFGDDTGVCAKQCQPGEPMVNDLLGCPAEEACEPVGGEDFNFGQCGFACEPVNFPSDTSSPDCTMDTLGRCLPGALQADDTREQAFCEPSGSLAVGDDCGEVSLQNCEPSALCRREPVGDGLNSILFDPVLGISQQDDGGVCREVCELFAGTCADGTACAINGSTLSSEVGFCLPTDPALTELEAGEACSPDLAGKMCGDGSYCTNVGGGAVCVQFCELSTGDGCSAAQSCSRLFNSDDVNLGICQ